MATLHITLVTGLSKVQRSRVQEEAMPVTPSSARAAQTMTTTGTSTESTLIGGEVEMWIVTSRDADHWVNFDAVAGPNAGFLVLAGTTREFSAKYKGKLQARTV